MAMRRHGWPSAAEHLPPPRAQPRRAAVGRCRRCGAASSTMSLLQSVNLTSAMSIEGAAFVLTARARAWPAHRGEVVNALALASRKPRATRTRMVLFGVGVVKAVAVMT